MQDLNAAHGARLTIDVRKLVANWRFLAEKVAPAQCAAVIKADAYGLGLERVARALVRAGAKTLFVAHLSEGVRARAVAKDVQIFILNGLAPDTEHLYPAYDLIPVLGSLPELERWGAFCIAQNSHMPAALHFDTGMNRHGFSLSEIAPVKAIAKYMNIQLILSHFTQAEMPDVPQNARQMADFAMLRGAFPDFALSLANSSGIFLKDRPYYDMVRPGYALYGGNPTPYTQNPMKDVISLSATLRQIRQIEAGAQVGYGSLWTAKRPSRLGLLSLGYADGLPRAAKGTDAKTGAVFYIHGQPCPVVGGISMDLTVIDVTDAPQAEAGSEVEIIGPHQSLDQLGAAAGTIGYEILTRLGRRFERTYLDI